MSRSPNPVAGVLPAGVLPLGLGCSRLGSVNGASASEARVLLKHALDEGIRFFDTSNIYGQGDSERLLAEVLGRREDCVICSKAGRYLDWKKRLLLPLKGALRGLARRSGQTRQTIASARAKPMPTRWEPGFLLGSLDASLRRLNRSQIEIFMLHSPDAEVMRRGDAIGALEQAQAAGKIGIIGVSVDDVASAEAALRDPRVRALQLPLRPGETEFDAIAGQAAAVGVAVIAREVLGGAAAIAGAVAPAAYARARIIDMVHNPAVAMSLVGTTKSANLSAATAAARAGLGRGEGAQVTQ